MGTPTESPKKEDPAIEKEEDQNTNNEKNEDLELEDKEPKKTLGGSKWTKIPPPSEVTPDVAAGDIEEMIDIMKVIKQRNFIRRLATKMRKMFIPNSINRYMQLSKVAKAWKKIKFPFNPKRFLGLSKAKNIGRLWKPKKRPSHTAQEVQNVFVVQKFARTWKRGWLAAKWAKLFPKNFIQIVKFKTVISRWKGLGLKKALTKVYRVLAARIRVKKWKKKKKPKKPEMSLQTVLYLKRQTGKMVAEQRRIRFGKLLPKSFAGLMQFRIKVKKWEKVSALRKLARIFIPRNLINFIKLKRKALKWKKFAGFQSGLGEVTKVGFGISGMGLDGKMQEGENGHKGAFDTKGQVDGGTEADGKQKNTTSSSGQGDGNDQGAGASLGRTESTMSSSGGKKVGGDNISEETGDSIGNLSGLGGTRGDGHLGATRGSVSGQGQGQGQARQGSMSQGGQRFEETRNAAGDVKLKIIKTEKEIKLEKLEKFKNEVQEAEKLLETSKELKIKAEKELDKIKPFYIAALEDSKLSPKLLLWIKSIRFNPPEAIRILMEAICVLKGIKPYVKYDKTTKTILFVDYWVPSKKLLGGDFAKELKALRKVGNHKLHYLKEFVGYVLPNEDFDRDKIEHAYPPCALLYDWIMSIYDFGTVSLKYGKRFKKLQEAEDLYYKSITVIKRSKHEISKLEKAIEREEKYNNRDHYTTKLTLLSSQQSYTYTVTGSSKRRYEYDFVNLNKK